MCLTDMKDARNYLLSEALPELQEFCHQNGLQFQLIDLNWGMSEDWIFDQDIYKVCLQQIQMCHQYSSGPFYVVSTQIFIPADISFVYFVTPQLCMNF